MQPSEALQMWSKACELTGIRWYLYRETLLCAHGYHAFPETLDHAQVVIFAEDLPIVLEFVTALLPKDWVYDKVGFTLGAKELVFQRGDQTVLSLDILGNGEDEASLEERLMLLKQVRSSYNRRGKYIRFAKKILSKLTGRPMKKRKLPKKAFTKVITEVQKMGGPGKVCTDRLTNKAGSIMFCEWFEKESRIQCDTGEYPVWEEYTQYLEAAYGDYEQGLFDDIGVGLTIEEKVDLREHQQHCREALGFLQELSEEFGLRYYLLAGSVLGPVREGGMIPWDDDIDVGIRIEDLEAFEEKVAEYLPKRLPEAFVLMQSGAENPFPRMFSKICYNGRCCIDLWPLIPTYVEGWKAKYTWYFGKMITKVHYDKIGHEVKKFKKIVRVVSPWMTDRFVMWLARRNERRDVGKNTPVYINLYSIYKRRKETIKREWLDHPEMMEYDGLVVPVVGCPKQYMVHLYGDYMKRPAPWKRASRHFERFFK